MNAVEISANAQFSQFRFIYQDGLTAGTWRVFIVYDLPTPSVGEWNIGVESRNGYIGIAGARNLVSTGNRGFRVAYTDINVYNDVVYNAEWKVVLRNMLTKGFSPIRVGAFGIGKLGGGRKPFEPAKSVTQFPTQTGKSLYAGRVYQIITASGAAAFGAREFAITQSGTIGSVSGVTATANATNILTAVTISSPNELHVGDMVKVGSDPVPKMIGRISGTTVTLDGAVSISGSGLSVVYSAPLYDRYGAKI